MTRAVTFEEMADFVAEVASYRRAKITLETGLRKDVGLDGDEAVEFFEKFRARFNVDLSGVIWDRHFGPEFSFIPFWMLFPSWWRWQKQMVEIQVRDLLASAEQGNWAIRYENRA